MTAFAWEDRHIAQALHTFPPRIIGQHEWLIAIVETRWGRCNEYFWRRVPEYDWSDRTWRRSSEWPSYNHDDGCFGGMPRTLRKYWEDHRQVIRHWIDHGCAPSELDAAQGQYSLAM